MRLLVDTDAFCKLAAGGVLDDALERLGVRRAECARLPALSYMLKRGRLRKRLGDQIGEQLIAVAEELPVAPEASESWLDKLVAVPDIDPGEAQIFAAAAEQGLLLVSGDKRALRALKDVHGFAEALTGRIVVIEAVMLALCDSMGAEKLRRRVTSLPGGDRVVAICFSEGNPNPAECFRSYFENLESELHPLVLWQPRNRGAT